MKYVGGKSRIGQQIAAYLNELRRPGQPYWEPFVGGLWVAHHIGPGPNYFSDAHEDLINLYKAILAGWNPPTNITYDEYYEIKAMDPCPLRTFVGYGSSFSGKYWGGYAREIVGDDNSNRYTKEAAVSLTWKLSRLNDPFLFSADYNEADVPIKYMGNLLIYCDPPYEGTTGYSYLDPFDNEKFWDKCREFSEAGHTVVVSEFNAPDDFSEVMSWPLSRNLKANGSTHITERLFRFGEHCRIQPLLFPME